MSKTTRIQITAGGIYASDGKEVPVGTILELKKGEPKAWAGRYTVLSGGEGKTAFTNPDAGLKAEHHGGGKFNVTQGEEVLLSGLSKAEADAFNAMSDEDKAAHIAAAPKA